MSVSNAPRKPCLDCDRPTWQPQGKSEWYMVQNHIWQQSGAPTRTVVVPGEPGFYLCIGCLEVRLGRELFAGDFTDTPVNTTRAGNTDRLNNRLVREPSEV